MRLRVDFIEAISRLYIEKTKPNHYSKLLEEEEREKKPLSFIKLALHKRSFYDLINK